MKYPLPKEAPLDCDLKTQNISKLMDINDKLIKLNPKDFEELTGQIDQSEKFCTSVIQGISKALKRSNELRVKQG